MSLFLLLREAQPGYEESIARQQKGYRSQLGAATTKSCKLVAVRGTPGGKVLGPSQHDSEVGTTFEKSVQIAGRIKTQCFLHKH